MGKPGLAVSGWGVSNRTVTSIVLAAVAMLFVAPPLGSLVDAGTPAALTPSADTWANRQRPSTNYGSTSDLRATNANAEAFLRFDTSSWMGKPVSAVSLSISGLQGSATNLTVDTVGAWKEGTLNWKSRPSSTGDVAGAPTVTLATARFDVTSLFPSHIVDRKSVSIRVRNS